MGMRGWLWSSEKVDLKKWTVDNHLIRFPWAAVS